MRRFLLLLFTFPLLVFANTPYKVDETLRSEVGASLHEVVQRFMIEKFYKGDNAFEEWGLKAENNSVKKDAPKQIVEKAQVYTQALKVEAQGMAGSGLCHGILISPTHILTAAHCVSTGSEVKVTTADNRTSRKIYINPIYSKMYPSGKYFFLPMISPDIAIVEMDAPTQNYFSFSKNKINLNDEDKQCFMVDVRDGGFAVKINEAVILRLEKQIDFSNIFYAFDKNIKRSFYGGTEGYSGGPVWCYDSKTDSLFLNGIFNQLGSASIVATPNLKALGMVNIGIISVTFSDYNYDFIESALTNSEPNEDYFTTTIRQYHEDVLSKIKIRN